MSVKILHCADLHLDSVFSFLPQEKEAEIRREDLRQTFKKIIETAREEKVDMLIISGDLFDSENASRQTLMFIANELLKIPEISVYICAGNHDPKTSNSYYNSVKFPENVHIFDTEMEKIERDDCDVYGVSFSDVYAQKSYLDGFSADNSEKINIMVMHGNFTSGEYNLITKEQMENSGIDYLALGHTHSFEVIKSKNCTAVFPGCPEGRGFDETDKKGVVLTEVSKGSAKVSFLPISRRNYYEIKADVTGLISYDDILNEIKKQMGEDFEKHLYKIVLVGQEEFDINSEVLTDAIKAFMVKIVKKTEMKIDFEKEMSEFSLKGLFIKKALSDIEDDDNEITRLTLKLGLDALFGQEGKR